MKVLSHIGVAAIAIVATLLFTRSCTPNAEPQYIYETIVECQTDTIVKDTTIFKTIVKTRTETKTIVHEVFIDTTDRASHLAQSANYYMDSTVQVFDNIWHSGEIHQHDQMVVDKRPVEYLFRTNTVLHTRDNIKLVREQSPRLLMGLYSTFNGYIPDQAGLDVTFVDNKYRQYTLAKDLRELNTWALSFKTPVLWKR